MERDQHKSSFVKPRVRYRQALSFQDPFIEGEDVQIQGPGPPTFATNPSEFVLDRLQLQEQLLRFQGCPALDHPVDEPILLGFSHRFGAVKGRATQERDAGILPQLLDGLANGAHGIAQVGSNANQDQIHAGLLFTYQIQGCICRSLTLHVGLIGKNDEKGSPG